MDYQQDNTNERHQVLRLRPGRYFFKRTFEILKVPFATACFPAVADGTLSETQRLLTDQVTDVFASYQVPYGNFAIYVTENRSCLFGGMLSAIEEGRGRFG
eukprot:1014564-Amphidinium_carterae.1